MLIAPFLLSIAALSQNAVSAPAAQPKPEYFEVIGTLDNLDYESINDPDDLLGHGWITARLRIDRILRGRKLPADIRVRYLAHTYLEGRAAMRLKLLRNGEGKYFVCAPRGGTGVQCP